MIKKHIELRELINRAKNGYCFGFSDLLKTKDLCIELNLFSESQFDELLSDFDIHMLFEYILDREKLTQKEQLLGSRVMSKISGNAYRVEYEYQKNLKDAQL
jgi:hypothetical protein